MPRRPAPFIPIMLAALIALMPSALSAPAALADPPLGSDYGTAIGDPMMCFFPAMPTFCDNLQSRYTGSSLSTSPAVRGPS